MRNSIPIHSILHSLSEEGYLQEKKQKSQKYSGRGRENIKQVKVIKLIKEEPFEFIHN